MRRAAAAAVHRSRLKPKPNFIIRLTLSALSLWVVRLVTIPLGFAYGVFAFMRYRIVKSLLIILILGTIVQVGWPTSQARQSTEITEVSLEITQGMNSRGARYGRAFRITLRRDGTALFTGKANVKLIGDYEGTIAPVEFEELVRQLESRHYSQIKSNQLATVRIRGGSINSPALITPIVKTIIKCGNQEKKIERAANETDRDNENRDSILSVPYEVFEIEKAITDASLTIKWKKVEK